jgi:hypothetical protein
MGLEPGPLSLVRIIEELLECKIIIIARSKYFSSFGMQFCEILPAFYPAGAGGLLPQG